MFKVVISGFILGLVCSISALFNPTSKILYNGDVMENSSLDSGNVEEEKSIIIRYDLNYESLNIPKVLGFKWNGASLNRGKKRQNGRNYHYQRNKMIYHNLGLEDGGNVYISKYFPCIEVYYTAQEWENECLEVYSLATNNYLDKINVISSTKEIDHLYSALYWSHAEEMVESGLYKGTDVKVGILESGVVDATSSSLSAANLVVRDEWFYFETVSEHATKMATAIGGTGGIAPKCSMYSVEAAGGLSSELDWLLEQDIDICNMSFGYATSKGTYKASQTAIIDYASYNYNIIFFAATGNTETDGVANPALGYNVIGVGSCDSDGSMAYYSTYLEDDDAPEKPNICVKGTGISLPSLGTTVTGTSISCAIMSGMCALMVEENPILRDRPEMAIATIMMAGQSPANEDSFSDKIGAGLLRYDYWRDFFGNNVYYTVTPQGGNTVPAIEHVMLEAGQKIKVAIAWDAVASNTSSVPGFNDYDLLFCSSKGILLEISNSKTSNYEVLEFTALDSGQHAIRIRSVSNSFSTGQDKIAMCYRIEF